MAKKEGIDESIYVKTLVDAGMDKAEAAESVARLVAKANEVLDGESNEAKQNYVSIMVGKKIKGAKATKYKALVVAAGPRVDANDIKRNVAMALYKKEATRDQAITEGLVAKINGEYVAVDNRRYLDAAGTMPNKGYGKPYQVKMGRELILIIDGKLTKATGDVSVVAGGLYDLYGGESKSGFIYVNSEPAPRLNRVVPETELWKMVFDAAKTSDHAMDINGALEVDPKGLGTVLVKGFIHSVGNTTSGNAKVNLNNETGSGIMVFGADEASSAIMRELVVGGEAIIIGRLKDAKDAQYGRQMTAIGAIANPASGSALSKALADTKDFEY